MKAFLFFLLLLPFTICNAQPKEKIPFVKEVNNFKASLETSDDFGSDLEKKLTIEFMVDTFRINLSLRRKLDKDYSTQGMIRAMRESEVEYDKTPQ